MEEITAGDMVNIYALSGEQLDQVPALQDIPAGHKIALMDLQPDELLYKYGQIIGRINQSVRRGDWVHTHNLESRRGRGDLRGT